MRGRVARRGTTQPGIIRRGVVLCAHYAAGGHFQEGRPGMGAFEMFGAFHYQARRRGAKMRRTHV
eukprot:11212221-Lingulodinium_polyedra.AAC.1